MDLDFQVEAVNKVIKYIEINIKKRMSLYEIARVAGYSPWYISKLFKQYIGINIFDYIRSLRLSKAALYIRDNDVKIVDVALEFIFESHEGFTRAFAKEFGINPEKYSINTLALKLFMPSPKIDYNDRMKGDNVMKQEAKTSTIFVQVIDRPKRKAIIKRGIKATHYFEYCEEVDCDIWEEISSIKGASSGAQSKPYKAGS